MADVEIYTKSWCGYSAAALQLLDHKGVQYEHIDVTSNPASELEMMARAGAHTVPQIFIDGQGIGGYYRIAANTQTRVFRRITKSNSGHAIARYDTGAVT